MNPAVTPAHLLILFSWILAFAWIWQAIATCLGMPHLPDLTGKDTVALPPIASTDGPHISVIVPACNEAATIRATLHSLLESTGLRLEVIAVDDRSSDQTRQRMDEVAAEVKVSNLPHQLSIISVRALPEGWLGKPHAMALGARQSSAPWLLFTDGDVLFHPQALELALREALARKSDHFALVPSLILRTTGERAMLAAMQVLAQWTVRLWKVDDSEAKDFIGIGGFNLVRREVYTQVGGFEALKMEVLDDLRFGWKVKRAGFSQLIVVGPGLVRIRWINGVMSVVRLTEKNGFAVYRYKMWLLLLACLGLAVEAFLPLAALATGGWALAAGLVIYAAIFVVYAANRRVTQVSPWLVVFFAPATVIVIFAFLRSMVLTLARRGVDWRGTRYSLAELRRHAGSGW